MVLGNLLLLCDGKLNIFSNRLTLEATALFVEETKGLHKYLQHADIEPCVAYLFLIMCAVFLCALLLLSLHFISFFVRLRFMFVYFLMKLTEEDLIE